MKQKTIFITFEQQGRFKVKYAAPPGYDITEFDGVYDDPGEAIREFSKHEQDAELLQDTAFQRRIRQHQETLAKLRSWQEGANS